MRSRIKTSAIVLLLASAAGGTAMAATPPDNANTINHESAPVTQKGTITVAQPKTRIQEPRLKHIMAELRLQNRRINRDHRQGLLTHTAFEQLKARRMQIRERAVKIAGRHEGKLPLRPYIALQASIKALNVSIRHKLTA